MRALAFLAVLSLAGCITPLPDGGREPEPTATRTATAADLLEGAIAMEAEAGWVGTHLVLDPAFWNIAGSLRDGPSFKVSVHSFDYFLMGVRISGNGMEEPPSFLGGVSTTVTIQWDPALVGADPTVELVVLGGRGLVLGQGAAREFLPHFNGTDGAGGQVLRVPFDEDTVLLANTGVLQFDETYLGGVVTPAGTVVPQRVSTVEAADRLDGKGVLAMYFRNLEPAGAARWSYTLEAEGHSSGFEAAAAQPGAEQADAERSYLQAAIGEGDVRFEFERTFHGVLYSNMTPVQGSVFYVTGAWASFDPALVGWEVPTITPADVATARVLELVPEA